MANQIRVESGSGNITVTTSRAVIGTLANVENANTANFANVANTANVANIALDVDIANVNGAGNIATLNLDGNASNVLYGNGVFAEAGQAQLVGDGGNLSNLNGANVTGFVSNAVAANTAFSVDGANVSGEVANANYASFANVANSANAIDGANVSGEVANANFASFAGNANVANSANSVDGANVVGEVAVANTVSNPTQSNITAVGTLTDLDVSGNIVSETVTANTITANVFVGNISATDLDYIDFDTANGAPSHQTGRLAWDAQKLTLTLGMDGEGNIDQQIGEDQYIYVKANATITAGQVVQFGGVQGDTILGIPANTTNSGFLPRYVIGVAPANIASGNSGYVQTFGEIYNLNTFGLSEGSILYLEPNTQGALTSVEPTAPDPKIVVAACLTESNNPSATNGRIQVRPEFGYYMDQLHDVSNTASADDVLVYDGNVWQASNTVPVANSALSVDVANVSNIGNIATIDLDGSNSNVLYGNGAFDAIPVPNRIEDSFQGANTTLTGNLEFILSSGFQGDSIRLDTNLNNTTIASYTVTEPNNPTFPIAQYNARFRVNTDESMGFAGTAQRPLFETTGVVDETSNNLVGFRFESFRQDANTGNTVVLQQGDGLGSLEWRPYYEQDFGGGFVFVIPSNPPFASINGIVDVYDGNANVQPEVGLKFDVIGDNSTVTTHRMYSNGAVEFDGDISANNLGNIASVDLTGSNANVLYGNGVFAAPPAAGAADSISNGNSSITFTGVNGDINVVVDSANTISIAPNSVDVFGDISANNLGNISSVDLSGNSDQVLLGDGSFGTAPTPTSIQNDTSSASFTGPGGDLNIQIDGTVRSQFTPSGLVLQGGDGANTPAEIARLDINNGSLFWTLDNVNFSGGQPFGMNVIDDNNSFISPLRYERARGNADTRTNVQEGDGIFNEVAQAWYQFSTEPAQKNCMNRSVNVNTIDAPNNYIDFSHFYGGSDDGNGVYRDSILLGFDEVQTYNNLQVDGDATVQGNISANNLGNIASVDLDGDSSNILYGNGVFAPAPGGSSAGVTQINYSDLANTYVLAANVEQGILFTIDTAAAGNLTIDVSNLPTANTSKTYYIYVENQSGNTQNVDFTNAQELPVSPLNIPNNDALSRQMFTVDQYIRVL